MYFLHSSIKFITFTSFFDTAVFLISLFSFNFKSLISANLLFNLIFKLSDFIFTLSISIGYDG